MKYINLFIAVLLVSTSACDKAKIKPVEAEKVGNKTEKAVEKKIEKKTEKPTSQPADTLGQWVTMDSYGIRFRVPSDWKVKKTAEAASVNSPDGMISVFLLGTNSENMIQSTLENLKKEVVFEEVKMTTSGATVINGMPGYSAEGTAVHVHGDNKDEIQFIIKAVKMGDKAASLLVFADAAMYEAKKEEITGLVNTLKKR